MQIFGRPRRKSLIPNIFRFHFDAHKLKLPLWGVGPYLSKVYNWIWKLFPGLLVRACEFCSLNRACTELVLGRVLRQQSAHRERLGPPAQEKPPKHQLHMDSCKNILPWGFKNNLRDRLWMSWSSRHLKEEMSLQSGHGRSAKSKGLILAGGKDHHPCPS